MITPYTTLPHIVGPHAIFGEEGPKPDVRQSEGCTAMSLPLARRMAKTALPGQTLSCGFCRATTHGNTFAVHLARTATSAFPVVLDTNILTMCRHCVPCVRLRAR
jgi:hypothetical protein